MGDSASSTRMFRVGRPHCRDCRLDDTYQSADRMVPENDRGVSDCRNSL